MTDIPPSPMEPWLHWADYHWKHQVFTLVASQRGLSLLALPHDRENVVSEFLKAHPARQASENSRQLAPYLEQLDAYFSAERTAFDLPVAILSGTAFQRRVWQALRQIPYGQTRSYAEVATLIEHPRAYRAVGTAVSQNPVSIVIPCHRVIGSNGTLTGFAGGLELKQHLLHLEGVHDVKAKGHAKYAY